MDYLPISQIPPNLIPTEAVVPLESDSGVEFGAGDFQIPLLCCQGFLVDGLKRLESARRAGIPVLPVISVAGEPWSMRFHANRVRSWNLVELALVSERLSEDECRFLWRGQGHSISPDMRSALAVLVRRRDWWPLILEKNLPTAIFRDMAALGDAMERFLADLLRFPGTVGEKRVLAGLFKQCVTRNVRPGQSYASLSEARADLQTRLEPRRSEALTRWQKVSGTIKRPPGVDLRIDETFEKPGITVTIQVFRDQTEVLEATAQVVRHVFAHLPEL
jgi:hypothetical protein